MSPTLIAAFFAVLGFVSLWSIMNDLGTGNASTRGSTINVREKPGGFYLVVFCKAAFFCFAIAVVLHALGLIGDPFVWMRQTFPFLMPR
jgi:hypothetical protein